jgi:hypothetical protein
MLAAIQKHYFPNMKHCTNIGLPIKCLNTSYKGGNLKQINVFNFPWSLVRHYIHSGSIQPESKLGHPVRMATVRKET